MIKTNKNKNKTTILNAIFVMFFFYSYLNERKLYMLLAERHQKIVDLVNLRSSIRVSELSDIFSVTDETIRRDLEKLEKENKLRRSHGGAVSIEKKE